MDDRVLTGQINETAARLQRSSGHGRAHDWAGRRWTKCITPDPRTPTLRKSWTILEFRRPRKPK